MVNLGLKMLGRGLLYYLSYFPPCFSFFQTFNLRNSGSDVDCRGRWIRSIYCTCFALYKPLQTVLGQFKFLSFGLLKN